MMVAALHRNELSWRLSPQPGGVRVELAGEIDENADLSDLLAQIPTRHDRSVVLDLAGVRRINSCGVREWVSFIQEMPRAGAADVTFVACSPAMVRQMNMVYNFRGPARVSSFLAPYVCARCGHDEEKLLDVARDFPGRRRQAPTFACPSCHAAMELDDIPERYLSFLNDT